MKYTIEKNLIIAHAETVAESIKLLTVMDKGEAPSVEKKTVVNRKKPLHTKKCPECGKKCKGNVGLGIHRRFAHNVKGIITLNQEKKKKSEWLPLSELSKVTS